MKKQLKAQFYQSENKHPVQLKDVTSHINTLKKFIKLFIYEETELLSYVCCKFIYIKNLALNVHNNEIPYNYKTFLKIKIFKQQYMYDRSDNQKNLTSKKKKHSGAVKPA